MTLKKNILRIISQILIFSLLVAFPQNATTFDCDDGTAIPPFLGEGVDPNLLLIIDSSGSMYDLAYDDLDEPEFCNDDSYIASTPLTWNVSTTYRTDELVLDGTTIYKAQNDITAGGNSPSSDGLSNWRPAFEAYADGSSYLIGDLVSDSSSGSTLWYKATTNGTSNGDDTSSDTGVEWTSVPTSYAGYFDTDTWYGWDTNATRTQFTTISGTPVCDTSLFSSGVTFFSNSDTCIALDAAGTTFKGFAAKGNLLNWAASSKFDIEKKILTGGKYDSANSTLVKESRGCVGRRMVKQVRTVDSGGNHKYLSLGITSDYDITTAENATTKIQIFEPSDDGFQFANEACEAAITASSFGQVQNLASDCLEIGKQNESFANSNAAFNHGFQTCWGYPTVGNGDITRMVNACEKIYDDGVNPYDIVSTDGGYVCGGSMSGDDFGPGDGSGYVGKCIDVSGAGSTGVGGGACSTITDTPGGTYSHPYYIDGNAANPTSNDWILCGNDSVLPYGTKGSETMACIPGTAYTCPSGYTWDTSKNACRSGNIQYWEVAEDCPAPGVPASSVSYSWVSNYDDNLDDSGLYPIPDPYPNSDGCVEMAIREYCQEYYAPPIIDPSTEPVLGDNATSQFPNLPAILVDVAASAQLGEPMVEMIAQVPVTSQPTGLLQSPAYSSIRFGLMTFNYDGADYECDQADPNHLYDCGNATIRDGSAITTGAYLYNGSGHTDDLAETINAIQARAWTPMAETMYNALGYFGQKTSMRLDSEDFTTKFDSPSSWAANTMYTKGDIVTWDNVNYWATADGTSTPSATSIDEDVDVSWEPIDPVTAYCQSNNILILSDGAPTADINSLLATFSDGNGDDIGDCGDYDGSTYLDDLAFFGANSTSVYQEENFVADFGATAIKQNIKTYVVTTGALKTSGTENECRADVLLEATAINGDPDGLTSTYFNGENPEDLQSSLEDIFAEISSRASSGSAASVISASRSGEGAIYQAIFWPRTDRTGIDANNDGNDEDLLWTGEVHALFVDSQGYMYEDTDGDKTLDLGSGGDNRVITFFNESLNKTQGCYVELVSGSCPPASTVEIDDIKYLWSANDWLAKIGLPAYDGIDARDVLVNRSTYISDERKRYIFTWNDLNNDGIVTSNEILDFVDRQPSDSTPTTDWEGMTVSGSRGAVNFDFNASDNATTNEIVRWIRGYDDASTDLRNRSLTIDLENDGATDDVITWRLGDIIHSTPVPVGTPQEYYHFLYSDKSYAQFINHYRNRRNVIYFGANDGMVHAINGGFFDTATNSFRLNSDLDCTTPSSCSEPELGAELWAYVPYNLLPHLQCLTDVDYNHKYYVDQRPRIFDVRIWPYDAATETDDGVHINGWGTIMVAGMRLGGHPTLASDLHGDTSDEREFTSAYIIFDITDPESPPTVLGEYTRTTEEFITSWNFEYYTDLGFTTAIPTMIVMKDGTDVDDYSWYLAFGSGPNGPDAMQGVSDQYAKISILPLNWLGQNGETKRPFRIPFHTPFASFNWPPFPVLPQGGTFTLSHSPNGFVSNPITVDFELEANYMSDALYFGTIEGNFTNWEGKMYRLVTRKLNASSQQETTLPSEWSSLPSAWTGSATSNPSILHDAQQPVTSSASIGVDPYDNFWVYFGTGRFFDNDDKGDNSNQTYYGIKEPTDCDTGDLGKFTWETVEKTGVYSSSQPGSQGLQQVDQILVAPATGSSPYTAGITCIDGSENCRLDENNDAINSLGALEDYIEGDTCNEGQDGWYRNFQNPRERNLGQATLLGGLTVFTSYQPFEDSCKAEGQSNLYAIYYRTGTPWIVNVFGNQAEVSPIPAYISLGQGLALTPNLHLGRDSEGPTTFVQTSTGKIEEIPQINLPVSNFKSGLSGWGGTDCD